MCCDHGPVRLNDCMSQTVRPPLIGGSVSVSSVCVPFSCVGYNIIYYEEGLFGSLGSTYRNLAKLNQENRIILLHLQISTEKCPYMIYYCRIKREVRVRRDEREREIKKLSLVIPRTITSPCCFTGSGSS